jgi:hypothetical protein
LTPLLPPALMRPTHEVSLDRAAHHGIEGKGQVGADARHKEDAFQTKTPLSFHLLMSRSCLRTISAMTPYNF